MSQNLISNPSFSDVYSIKDTLKEHRLLPGKLSDVKDWYLPTYINYKKHLLVSQFSSLYGSTYYMSSRDKNIFIKNRYFTNSEQLFENNLGFIELVIDYFYPKTTVQQRLTKPITKGKYCFKFKYKYEYAKSLNKNIPIEFCFSDTDLKEYYQQKLTVPPNIINVSFIDAVTQTDENTPWQQKCYVIYLKGNEHYLTLGGLSNPHKPSTAVYWLDDIELTRLTDTTTCVCDTINKNLAQFYHDEFPINEEISNDTLVMFLPHNGFVPNLITPDEKIYLYKIISFMQRHPKVKIKYLEYTERADLVLNQSFFPPMFYQTHQFFLTFYGINKNRISGGYALCGDPKSIYCGTYKDYVKIGFKFYYD